MNKQISTIFVIGWYDGPTFGFFRTKGSESFVFRLLRWRRATNTRIFAIAQMTDCEFDASLKGLGILDIGTVTVWLPNRIAGIKPTTVESFFDILAILDAPTKYQYGVTLDDSFESVAGYWPLLDDDKSIVTGSTINDSDLTASEIDEVWANRLDRKVK